MGLNKTHFGLDIAQLFPFYRCLEYFFFMESNIHFRVKNTVEVTSGNVLHVHNLRCVFLPCSF